MVRIKDRFSEDVCRFASNEIRNLKSIGANVSEIECIFSNQSLNSVRENGEYELAFDFELRNDEMREMDYTFRRQGDIWVTRNMLARSAPGSVLSPFAEVFTAVVLTFVWDGEKPCQRAASPTIAAERAHEIRVRIMSLLAAWNDVERLWDAQARKTAELVRSKIENQLETRLKHCARVG